MIVSDRFARAANPFGEPWPLEPGSVSPTRVTSRLAELRIHPGDLCAEQLRPFIPGLAEVDPARDHRPAASAAALAEAVTVHAAATWVLEHEPWDFLAVHYAGLEPLCDQFLRLRPAAAAGRVRAGWCELYGEVVSAGYRFFDKMLARLIELAGDDATVMLVSDHGYLATAIHPDGHGLGSRAWSRRPGYLRRGRPRPSPRRADPRRRAAGHRAHGAGAVRPARRRRHGRPAAPGHLGEPPRLATIPSWDDRVARRDAGTIASIDPDGALADLRAQGYDDGPPPWLPGPDPPVAIHRVLPPGDGPPRRTAARARRPDSGGLHDESPRDAVVALYLAYAALRVTTTGAAAAC